jgi:hypothetical protein
LIRQRQFCTSHSTGTPEAALHVIGGAMANLKVLRGGGMPPLLAHVSRAIAQHKKAGTNQVRGDLPAALAELSALAAVSVITRGITASEEFRSAVDDIAARHLDGAGAERDLTRALAQIKSVHHRNAVEVAHARVLDLRELAHYYAGLASGVTIVELGRD